MAPYSNDSDPYDGWEIPGASEDDVETAKFDALWMYGKAFMAKWGEPSSDVIIRAMGTIWFGSPSAREELFCEVNLEADSSHHTRQLPLSMWVANLDEKLKKILGRSIASKIESTKRVALNCAVNKFHNWRGEKSFEEVFRAADSYCHTCPRLRFLSPTEILDVRPELMAVLRKFLKYPSYETRKITAFSKDLRFSSHYQPIIQWNSPGQDALVLESDDIFDNLLKRKSSSSAGTDDHNGISWNRHPEPTTNEIEGAGTETDTEHAQRFSGAKVADDGLDLKELRAVPALDITGYLDVIRYSGGDAGSSRMQHKTEYHSSDRAQDEERSEAHDGGGGGASTEVTGTDNAACWEATVKVRTSNGSGSGIILHLDGYLITNHHVVSGSGDDKPINDPLEDPIRVQVLETEYVARCVGSDPKLDIAVLKINVPENAQLQAIRRASDESLAKLGLAQKVLVIGYRSGVHEKTVFVGHICAPPGDKIKIQNAITFGNSGGPVCSDDGRMIGMVSSLMCEEDTNIPSGIGFAIPLKTVTEVADKMIMADRSKLIKRRERFGTDLGIVDNLPPLRPTKRRRY